MQRASLQHRQENIKYKLALEYHSNLHVYEKLISIAKPLIEYKLLKLKTNKKPWERIDVLARVKSFDSALNKLKKKTEGNLLFPTASFRELHDMAALKIRVFPNEYFRPVDKIIMRLFPGAIADHKPARIRGIRSEDYYNKVIHLKYTTKLDRKYRIKNMLEIQIVPFILDAFMEIEHDVIYKPDINIPTLIPKLMEDANNSLVDQLKTWTALFSSLMSKYGRS